MIGPKSDLSSINDIKKQTARCFINNERTFINKHSGVHKLLFDVGVYEPLQPINAYFLSSMTTISLLAPNRKGINPPIPTETLSALLPS